jgi:hypothetical protein
MRSATSRSPIGNPFHLRRAPRAEPSKILSEVVSDSQPRTLLGSCGGRRRNRRSRLLRQHITAAVNPPAVGRVGQQLAIFPGLGLPGGL